MVMANLTITVEGETLKQARQRALAEGRSVNVLLREYLEAYSGRRREHSEALSDLLALAELSQSGSGGHVWTRDELHDRN